MKFDILNKSLIHQESTNHSIEKKLISLFTFASLNGFDIDSYDSGKVLSSYFYQGKKSKFLDRKDELRITIYYNKDKISIIDIKHPHQIGVTVTKEEETIKALDKVIEFVSGDHLL